LNQFLYLLIPMWVYPTVPDKMVMVIAVIFGAHLLPFGWLYKSKAYTVMSVTISLTAIVTGIVFTAAIVAIIMIVFEIAFSIWLMNENRLIEFES